MPEREPALSEGLGFAPPAFFAAAQCAAHQRWDQLQADPELSGPWYQLFQQLRSEPRHVLSELLQNADDAGATWARAWVQEDVFRFEHNGGDFDEGDFRSLCRFAYSNKRSLHTIGFRGIGFKTTFSLGRRVYLLTPSLTVAFDEERFTEPLWLENGESCEYTRIEIPIESADKLRGIEEDLKNWTASGIPLLFFQSIRELEMQGVKLVKSVSASQLATNCQEVELSGADLQRILLITSEEEPFPPEALEEVREERRDPSFELPPCRVSLVLSSRSPQRIYVVLPTDTILDLPFSCNAPFLQDPARIGVKSPRVSPTNRWLLDRLGRLAASTMQTWLSNDALDLETRSRAYELLLPSPPSGKAQSLSMECTDRIATAFGQHVDSKTILLTADARLVEPVICLDLPADLLRVWTQEQNLRLFADKEVSVLAPQIAQATRGRLAHWHWLRRGSSSAILKRLSRAPWPPRPAGDDRFAILWALAEEWISKHDSDYRRGLVHEVFRINPLAVIPVKGGAELLPSTSITVMGSPGEDLSQEDWVFLGRYIPIADPEWLIKMRETERQAQGNDLNRDEEHKDLLKASSLMRRLDLSQQTGLARAIERAAQTIFDANNPDSAGISLAYLAARANVRVPDIFRYLCDDGKWRLVTEGLLVDVEAALEFLPIEWAQAHLTSTRYDQAEQSRDRQAWERWAGTPNSRLRRFPLTEIRRRNEYWRPRAEEFMLSRGGHRPSSYPLQRDHFTIVDYDFDDRLWELWNSAAQESPQVWARIAKGISRDWAIGSKEWKDRSEATVRQEGNSYYYSIEHGSLTSAWLHRLRSLQCLPDRFERYHLPAELYRTTAETSHLQDIEPFLNPDYDKPEYSGFWDLLGVRSKPEGVERIIERIRALSQSSTPPLSPLSDLYRALDRSMTYLSPTKKTELQVLFGRERLIFSEDRHWHVSTGVFRENPQGVPDVSVILHDVTELRLWDALGVPDQPTLERMVAWVKQIPPNASLAGTEISRVRSILARAPQRVWEEVKEWLNHDACWVPIAGLRWKGAATEFSQSLFPGIRRATADISMLPSELREQPPFSALEPLERALYYHLENVHPDGPAHQPDWLRTLAYYLLRVREGADTSSESDVTSHTCEAGNAAGRLYRTRWQTVTSLQVTPYLDGQPAGDRESPPVRWHGEEIYVLQDGAGVYDRLVDELARVFAHPKVKKAIAACTDRSPAWISAYFEANFELGLAQIPVSDLLDSTGDGSAGRAASDADSGMVDQSDHQSADALGEGVSRLGWDGDSVPLAANDVDDSVQLETAGRRTRRGGELTKHQRFVAFATNLGFRWDSLGGVFSKSDGMIIRRAEGLCHWQQLDHGKTLHQYWVGDRPLEQGVEIPAEIWEFQKARPDEVILLLPDADGVLRAYNWSTIERLRREKAIELYPAVYRLRKTEAVPGPVQ